MGITVGKLINTIGFKISAEDVNKVNSTVNKIKDTAKKALGAIGVGISIVAVNSLVEEFSRVNDQIRNSTIELGEQKEIQDKILTAARNTRTTYQQTATMVSNLVQENSELFGTIDEAIAFNNAVTMLFKAAGKTNEDIAQLMEAINKSFAKGYIDSETLSQLLERAPEAVEILNQYLGTTSDQLEELATDGKFSVAQLKDAFVSNSETIAQNFAHVQYRISEAITHIRDKFGYWLADLNESTRLTDTIAKRMISGFDVVMGVLNKIRNGIVSVTNKFGGMDRVLRFIAIAATTIFAVLNFGKIVAGVQTVIKWVKNLNMAMVWSHLKVAALIGIIVALVLIVEDFVHFMLGNDSLLGEILERAGIDADVLRETIKRAFQDIADFITSFGKGFASVFAWLGGVLSDFWGRFGDDILGAIGAFAGFFSKAIATIASFVAGSEIAQATMYNLGQEIGLLTAAFGIFFAMLKIGGAIKALVTNPISWIIAALLLLVAVVYLVIDNWELIKQKASEIWNAIKETIAGALESLEAFMHGFWPGVAAWLDEIWNAIVEVAVATWESFMEFLVTLFTAIADLFKRIWNSIKTLLTNVWNQIKNTASNIWNSIKTTLSNILNAIKTTMQNVWNTIKTTITNILNNIKTTVTNIWNNIKSFMSSVLNAIKTTVTNVWNAIKDFVSNVLNTIKTTVTNIWNAISSTTSAIWEAIKSKVSEVVNGIKETVTSVFESVKTTVSNVWNNIKQTISDAMTNAWQTVKDMVAKIKDAFNFEWTLPKFKLPHVSVHGGTPPYGIGGEGSLPSFSVDWYRKGGILDGATIFGAMGGKLLGGGEAGKEAVIPLSELWKNMRYIIRDGLNDVARIVQPIMGMSTVSASTVSNVSNSSTKTIVINNTFNQHFTGEKAAQKHSAEAMKTATTDISGQFARALNYT